MGVFIYVAIWIFQIRMLQNMNFKYQEKSFVIVIRKDSNRGPQNQQKTSCNKKKCCGWEEPAICPYQEYLSCYLPNIVQTF